MRRLAAGVYCSFDLLAAYSPSARWLTNAWAAADNTAATAGTGKLHTRMAAEAVAAVWAPDKHTASNRGSMDSGEA
jgi:hypothetical protein